MVVGTAFTDESAAGAAKPGLEPPSGDEGDVLRLTKRLVACLTASQKISLLQDLLVSIPLPHCVSLQVADLLHRSCPPNCGDFVRWLPDETSLRIFSFLDPVSLARCAQVNRCWLRLARDPSLWRRMCAVPAWRCSADFEELQLCRSGEQSPDWRAIFAERFRLRQNWQNSRCHVRTFQTNQANDADHGGVTCVDFDERRIVVGSCNHGNIQIWRRKTNATWSVQKVVCHSGAVRCLQLRGSHLVTGSSDHTIKLWKLALEDDWSGMVCQQTFLGHSSLVRCIQMNDKIVISGSYDHTLKLWDLETGECSKTFKGHTGEIWSLQFDSEKILSSSGDTTIRVWNFEGRCLRVLLGHEKGVSCIAFSASRLVSGSHDCTLRFWDLVAGTCERVIDWKAGEGHKDVVRCVVTDGRRVLSASDDKAIKEWDLRTGRRLQTLCGHEDGVTCIQFNDQVIVSGSFDQSVRLWDFSVC